jgi:hypothetical protein
LWQFFKNNPHTWNIHPILFYFVADCFRLSIILWPGVKLRFLLLASRNRSCDNRIPFYSRPDSRCFHIRRTQQCRARPRRDQISPPLLVSVSGKNSACSPLCVCVCWKLGFLNSFGDILRWGKKQSQGSLGLKAMFFFFFFQ